MIWYDDIPKEKWLAKLFANIGDPDQMLHFAVSDLGLHCFPVALQSGSQA